MAKSSIKSPKPGTPEARAVGCSCPVMDNCNGLGRGGDGRRYGWYISSECEFHRIAAGAARAKL